MNNPQVDGDNWEDSGRLDDGTQVLKCARPYGSSPKHWDASAPHPRNPRLRVFYLFIEITKRLPAVILGGGLGYILFDTVGAKNILAAYSLACNIWDKLGGY